MLRRASDLQGNKLEATDGDFASVSDFLFDDEERYIRYLVADTGTWLPGRKVLLSPAVLRDAGGPDHSVSVNLSRAAIEASPALDSDLPVSRQQERDLAMYYGLPFYWLSDPGRGTAIGTNNDPQVEHQLAAERDAQDGDQHLRSVKELTGYYVAASDGNIGHIEDLIVDTDNWCIRYAVIDTRNWWPGKKVMIGFQWIQKIDWSEATMTFDASRDQIRNSPSYDPSIPVDREYEEQLHDFYARPKYWEPGNREEPSPSKA